MISVEEKTVLRDLAKAYRDLCDSDRNQANRERWRSLNNMSSDRPLVFCNTGLLGDDVSRAIGDCKTSLKGVEYRLRRSLWLAELGDDRVFFPWFTVRAEMFSHPEGVWGVPLNRVRDEISRGWRNLPVLKRIEDLERLKATGHRVLNAHPERAVILEDAIGDILPVHVDRTTVYPVWGGTDLSEAAGALFGLEELMMLLCTEPEMLHRFMAFTRDAVLANLKQGEAAGDYSTADSRYYADTPAICDALPEPLPNAHGAALRDLAWFTHAQEFEGVSPDMHKEFLLDYQMPILELFGRVTYGCCETLDRKLDMLKEIPNLTKVLSGPRSDPAPYPEAFGDRCVISWRPIASLIALPRFDEAAQRRQLREGFEKLKGCQVEVHLHEPMSVAGDLSRLRTWVRIAREEADRVA